MAKTPTSSNPARNPNLECDELVSTCFASACYDDVQETLDVVFQHGQRRRYYGVPPQIAARLMGGRASAGGEYNKRVKGQFDTRRLPGSGK